MAPSIDSDEPARKSASVSLPGALKELQSKHHLHVLDILTSLHEYELDSAATIPSIVVCGDRGVGKSSVLEALTGIPFSCNGSRPTAFPIEIAFKRDPVESYAVSIAPHLEGGNDIRNFMNMVGFKHNLTSLDELPTIISEATRMMGLELDAETSTQRVSRHTLKITVSGPDRPHVRIVDLPGIGNGIKTDGTDEKLIDPAAITDFYIRQPQSICLPVLPVSYDYSGQQILASIGKYDAKGQRTLGIITKADLIEEDSMYRETVLELIKNQTYHLPHGWHVLDQGSHQESGTGKESKDKRLIARSTFLNSLPKVSIGIDSLRSRLNDILLKQVYQGLPRLQQELESKVILAKKELSSLGHQRVTARDCRQALLKLSQSYHQICKAATDGHYRDPFFQATKQQQAIQINNSKVVPLRRFRTLLQELNTYFAEMLQKKGSTFAYDSFFNPHKPADPTPLKKSKGSVASFTVPLDDENEDDTLVRREPKILSSKEAIQWVDDKLIAGHGYDSLSTINPLIIAELFWEQSVKWAPLAREHMEDVAQVCEDFVKEIVNEYFPEDARMRIWKLHLQDKLSARQLAAREELKRLVIDLQSVPACYDEEYVDMIQKLQTSHLHLTDLPRPPVSSMKGEETKHSPSIKLHSYVKILDDLTATYKTQRAVFLANVITQVIERHLVRDLESLLEPCDVMDLSDEDVVAVASDSLPVKQRRDHLTARVEVMEQAQQKLHQVLRSAL